jgi:hypothetical protein
MLNLKEELFEVEGEQFKAELIGYALGLLAIITVVMILLERGSVQ